MQDTDSQLRRIIDKYRKEWLLVGATILATVLLIVGFNYLPSAAVGNGSGVVNVPVEFSEARRRAGNAADKITGLTNISRSNLERISEADRSGDYTAGLALIVGEIDRNEEVRETAVDLSEELRDMAKHINYVQPSEASAIGLSAVTTGIELVQRLINYNNNSQELLNTLRSRLENKGDEETRERIEELIGAMNEEAGIINNLGSEYKDLMLQFDGLTE